MGQIDDKYNELKDTVNFGNQLNEFNDYGGMIREYEHGAIFYHPVMGNTAHAVWGSIYMIYKSLGGHKENPIRGTRFFGFPLSDEKNDRFDNFRVSEFEWGVIYAKSGGATVYGKNYTKWKELGEEAGELGYPASLQKQNNHGMTISYFDFGCIVGGEGIQDPIVCSFHFPQLGNPGFINPAQADEIKNTIYSEFKSVPKSSYDYFIQWRPQLFQEIFENKFYLMKVVPIGEFISEPIILVPEVKVDLIGSVSGQDNVYIAIGLKPANHGSLKNRTLYNICLKPGNDDISLLLASPSDPFNVTVDRDPNHVVSDPGIFNPHPDPQHVSYNPDPNRAVVVAPHSIYCKDKWDNFSILHVTDIHISRRLEYGKSDLQKMSNSRPDLVSPGAEQYFNNFNNNFRDFIAYANYLHEKSSLDCILCTGDLVDYDYESGKPTVRTALGDTLKDIDTKHSNHEYFGRLLLGLEPSSDEIKNEELLVPIFTSLGNHDYRKYPHSWFFQLYTEAFGIATTLVEETNTAANTNVMYPNEVKALEGGTELAYNDKQGGLMAQVTTELDYYHRRINRLESYIIRLGQHRIVMLDTRYDIGIIDTIDEALVHFFGWDSEDSKKFADANPNSFGFTDSDIELLRIGLSEAQTEGLVIVGIHAPVMELDEYPHYLRETEHVAADEAEARRGFPFFTDLQYFQNGAGGKDDWPVSGTPYFKIGGIDWTLGSGVSKGNNKKFYEACLGVDIENSQLMPRKVDLILSGHGHRSVEFRVECDLQAKKWLFYHDYYTHNPEAYYAMRLLSAPDYDQYKIVLGASTTSGDSPQSIYDDYVSKMYYVRIIPKEGITAPIIVTDHRADAIFTKLLEVPAYSSPLNKVTDKKAWWTQHKPLFIETTALGPLETINYGHVREKHRLSEISLFQGCRKITIYDNVISMIESVTLKEVRAKGFDARNITTGGNEVNRNI